MITVDKVLIHDTDRCTYDLLDILKAKYTQEYELAYAARPEEASEIMEAGGIAVLVAEPMQGTGHSECNPTSDLMVKAKQDGVTVVLYSDIPPEILERSFGLAPDCYDHYLSKNEPGLDPLAKLIDQCLAERNQ